MAVWDHTANPQDFAEWLASIKASLDLPAFICDLARIEWDFYKLKEKTFDFSADHSRLAINPSLILVPVPWTHLFSYHDEKLDMSTIPPEPAPVHILMWQHPKTGKLKVREAEDIDLLALKMVLEDIHPRTAAETGNVSLGNIHTALNRAINQNLLIAPPSKITRHFENSADLSRDLNSFLTTDTFTLQWHITQACDLHCKHCYDRTDRSPMSFSTANKVLDDFYEFCHQMNVKGHISFTGGNPMLYPPVFDLYKTAADMGFGLAVLGNPTPAPEMEKLAAIIKPAYFQISLEGLEAHNDYIRGVGHFKRSMAFLDILREMNIFSMVMLTLTRDNLNQVLPLAGVLKDRADYFTFNRLATVGEGANLLLPVKKDFEAFLRTYETEHKNSSLLGLKDNLFNIIRHEKGIKPFGGCTGYGCGAAFNFVSLLPDGEVHACRKFPSPLGNMFETSLMDIYHSELAQLYRNGPEECRNCSLVTTCRGCLANTYSHGLDIFKDKDPFCFISTP